MSFSDLIYPFEWIVSWILWGWHSLFTTLGIPSDSGVAWTLSIVGLVVVMRAAMIPLFVKQIHASRRMQLIQPEMQKIQAKYKDKKDPDSRQAMTQETMDLYKRTGTNPFSSCLPILLQSPFFFGLFRVLNGLKNISNGTIAPIGPITRKLAGEAETSTFFGAQLSDKFIGANSITVQIVTILLIVLMSASTFTTQRQLMMKNMPASALDNPFAKQQKMLLYLMPLFFAISGVNFPIGVLLYWLTTNVWSMCQQFYVIRKMPAPGSLAEKAMQERRRKKGKPVEEFTVKGLDKAEDTEAPKPSGQRVQPTRNKKKKGAAVGSAKKPTTGGATTDPKPQTDN
ncbi:YidC/Oxa1 family membrane protein insertase [Phycicoccus badiiscoriae]|uniref:Membrane protein insertase YidC n=1 Tax=Pedococcus badiiscoriae TaxID=642776 RepID=A0A852WL57_9MICO|nr:membrane protein insertase YidC [Pedococcus badiiscoriae]NYG06935.1 YidC/Oxa1 family membrane protein insertase [Pedococcus badiiscoriae]